MQLRYTWNAGASPALSDYMEFSAAMDEATRTLTEHNRPGSELTVTKVECHGPDSPRWFLLWSADAAAADHPDAYPLTLAASKTDSGSPSPTGTGGRRRP